MSEKAKRYGVFTANLHTSPRKPDGLHKYVHVVMADDHEAVLRDLAEARESLTHCEEANAALRLDTTEARAERDRLAERTERLAEAAQAVIDYAFDMVDGSASLTRERRAELTEALAAFRSPSNGEGQG